MPPYVPGYDPVTGTLGPSPSYNDPYLAGPLKPGGILLSPTGMVRAVDPLTGLEAQGSAQTVMQYFDNARAARAQQVATMATAGQTMAAALAPPEGAKSPVVGIGLILLAIGTMVFIARRR